VLLKLVYGLGILGFYHRIRNRHVLTVISLHRVLAQADSRWATCDPLYTLSDRTFDQCVRFLRNHYSVISLQQLLDARQGKGRLPTNPVLITFDDGWADNFDYALPILRRHETPAALFVAAGAVDRREAFFQERLIAAWRKGQLPLASISTLWERVCPGLDTPSDSFDEQSLRTFIARLQQVPFADRADLLADLETVLTDPDRQMLTHEELRKLKDGGFDIGTHGYMHEPMTGAVNLDFELSDSRRRVAQLLGVPLENIASMSFPFSKMSKTVVERATSAGYKLMFGGGKALTRVDHNFPHIIARVGITESEIVDGNGRFMPHVLAAQLFRLSQNGISAA